MDENLEANDPYRTMDSGEDGIRPDFLKEKGGGARGALSAAENIASAAIAAKTGKAPTGGAKAAEDGAKASGAKMGGLKAGSPKKAAEEGFKSSVGKAEANEEKAGGFYNNAKSRGSKEEGEAKLDMPKGLKMAAPFFIVFIALGGILFLIVGMPILMIGAIDYNFQRVLGFLDTVGILEKQGTYVTAELAESGKFPSGYASDLASNGIEIGQVTDKGDFYRTDVYIANIEEKEGLVAAAGGFSYVSDDEGQLAMLYDGKIIRADEFVAAVESDPKLYAAYSGAANIAAKYYYSEDVDKVYADMGISRGNFNDWESTGSYDKDEEAYQKILTKILDNKADLVVGGRADNADPDKNTAEDPDGIGRGGEWDPDPDTTGFDGGTWHKNTKDFTTSGGEDGLNPTTAGETKEYIEGWKICQRERPASPGTPADEVSIGSVMIKYLCPIYSNERNHGATDRAAELLNTAVSSGEPYLSSNAFIAMEEAIQRARVDGDGPVNHVMNSLTEGTEVKYQDVSTGEVKTVKQSILETDNFRAVVSDAPYSLEEAENFGRDRVLKVTGINNKEVIKMTTVGVGDSRNSSSVSRNGLFGDSANGEVIKKANESVELATYKKNSEMFQSIVGGNRIIEGGSFLSNTINSKVIGAVPSNTEAISAYHQEVKEVLARKAEAERATLSPFDISSPNTFLGSIVHNLASATLKNYGGGLTAMSAMSTAGSMAGSAVANLVDSTSAEGADQAYTTISGNSCATVKAIGVNGDIYCTSHNTIATDYMNYNRDQWKNVVLYTKSDGTPVTIGDSLDEENKIKEKSDVAEFVSVGMDRYTTVGVRSANACESWHNGHDGLLKRVVSHLADMVKLYDVCKSVPEEISTGSKYTFGGEGAADYTKYLSGYMLYDEVYSLLSDEESSVSEFRDRYYAKYPQDHSEAGVIARRSGMTKAEAEIALAYADYLNMIASYDASDRYAFGMPLVTVEQPILETHSSELGGNLYAWYQKETEYRDERNRQEMTA